MMMMMITTTIKGKRQRSWFRHCATNRKFAASNPDEVTEFFNSPNHYILTVVLGSTQSLTESGTRNVPGV
jgi:hypothetical protein